MFSSGLLTSLPFWSPLCQVGSRDVREGPEGRHRDRQTYRRLERECCQVEVSPGLAHLSGPEKRTRHLAASNSRKVYYLTVSGSQKTRHSVAQLVFYLVSQDQNQSVGRTLLLCGGFRNGSASQMVGTEAQFCGIVELKFPLPCWLSGGGSFSPSRVCLHFLICGCLLPLSKPAASGSALTHSISLTSSSTCKSSCDTSGPVGYARIMSLF